MEVQLEVSLPLSRFLASDSSAYWALLLMLNGPSETVAKSCQVPLLFTRFCVTFPKFMFLSFGLAVSKLYCYPPGLY